MLVLIESILANKKKRCMMEAMTEANGVNNPYQSDLDVEEYYQTAISKLSGQDIERYHQLTRGSILDVDLKEVQRGFEGLAYRRFIKLHFHMASCDELLMAIANKFAALNAVEREAAKTILKLYDQHVLEEQFWLTDTGDVLDEMSTSFEQLLRAKGHQVEDRMKWDLFQLVSINMAVIALHDRDLRKIARIRRGLFFRP